MKIAAMDDAALAGLIRRYSPASAPIPVTETLPPARPVFPAGGFRAFLFDVYGTLFVSGSGDIGVLSGGPDAAEPRKSPDGETAEGWRVREALAPFGPGASAQELTQRFSAAVRARHEKLKAWGTAFPEIDVREIWAALLDVDAVAAREFALRFELAVNPAYPMPGLVELLEALRSASVFLGIVSNAQFFTPLLFQAFCGAPPEALGFLPELCVYSYRAGQAKPAPGLFQSAAARLQSLGVKPEETLYTGNDMLNDIWAASQAGFATALFAGDSRSLRLRRNDPRCAELCPNFTLKSLMELPKPAQLKRG